MAWIAIDAGTSVIKAVMFDHDGEEMAFARERTQVLHPKVDWSEQDMCSVWDTVVKTVREVAGLGVAITGVVTTAQGDGCWLVDDTGQPTGNAVLWNDGRARQIVQRWQDDGIVDKTFRSSGSVTYPGLPNAIWAWLDSNQPERIARARWSLTCNGWLFAQLTGRIISDLSDASNPFSDVRRGEWSDAVIRAFEGASHRVLLPPIARGKELVGSMSTGAAEALGLKAGTAVVMAPYDIVSTAYGSGAAVAGQACLILGTTICVEVITETINLESAPSGTTLALHDGLFLRAMPTLTGCEALDWAAKILEVDGLDALSELAIKSQRGSGGVSFLPYLSPAGERSPFLDLDASGSFHGMQLGTSRADLVRSVYEGLSYVVRECLNAAATAPVQQLHICGGGSRSDFWCQMIADVTGVRVACPADSEIGARGAHLFGMAATGEIGSIAEGVRRHVTGASIFEPEEEARAFYESRFARFKDLRSGEQRNWELLAEAR